MKEIVKICAIALLVFTIFGYSRQVKKDKTMANWPDSTVNQDSCVIVPKECILFGIDVSHYQSKIEWDSIFAKENNISFVIVRATMGSNRKDRFFKRNFENAKKCFIVGAYHYYDPNENSVAQANSYIRAIHLKSGNLRPILDIERMSKTQSAASLHKGLKNWLKIVGRKYKTKPILYSNIKFYNENLKGYFDDYPRWTAAYSSERFNDSTFITDIHQFSQEMKVCGIDCNVDGNNLQIKNLKKLILL